MKPFFVHVYYVVRSKVGVLANDHEEAMKKADEMLPDIHKRLEFSTCGCVNTQRDIASDHKNLPIHFDTESAEEVTGYMVDEVGDEQYERSVSYDASYEREQSDLKTLKVTGEERDTMLAALRFWQRQGNTSDLPEWDIAANGRDNFLDDGDIDNLCERINR